MSCKVHKRINGSIVYEAFNFASKEFRKVALNWDPIMKESHACFFEIEHLHNINGVRRLYLRRLIITFFVLKSPMFRLSYAKGSLCNRLF